ncbi:MAG: glycosyltransferase family 39 protein [Proteobacteria bacterium]|nr:glycosyltransferase family 39 protein [Pseudomonadota bacterium]
MSRHVERAALAAVLAVAALLLFARLGDRPLWQDEAETALLGRSVLVHGVPTAYDGRNLVSQESQHEFSPDDYTWFWTPWLSHYLTAASFAVLGESTWSARLPSVLLGLVTVWLVWCLTVEITGDRRAAWWSALLLATSVPFLLYFRQCRYYAPLGACTVWLVLEYLRLRRGDPKAAWRFAVASIGIFHSQYVAWGVMMAALGSHFLFDALVWGRWREHWKRLGIAAGVAVLQALPWLYAFGRNAAGKFEPTWPKIATHFRLSSYHLNHHAVPVLLLLGVLLLWAVHRWRPLPERRPVRFEGVDALAWVLVFSWLFVVWLMPFYFFRYFVFLVPLGAVATGLLLLRVRVHSPVVAAALLGVIATTDIVERWFPVDVEWSQAKVTTVLNGDEDPVLLLGTWAGFSPLAAYAYEVTRDVEDPVDVVVAFLHEHADPSDTIIATYGDLPLQFYTDLRVIGAMSSEDPRPLDQADWIWIRYHTHAHNDAYLKHFLFEHADWSQLEAIPLGAPDAPYGPRPDPTYHKFQTAKEGFPPMRIYRRKPRAAVRNPSVPVPHPTHSSRAPERPDASEAGADASS